MDIHEYPSPAQTSIFIGRSHVDDAFALHFEVQHPRVPLYSYNNNEYGVVADGKMLVTGNLLINYRYPGYLAHAIEDAWKTDTRIEPDINRAIRKNLGPFGFPVGAIAARSAAPHITGHLAMNRDQLRTTLKSLRATDDPNERLQIMALAIANGTFSETSALARALFGSGIPTRVMENPAQMSSRGSGFDIQIAYGDTSGPLRVDILRDCRVTGMAKNITASASGHGGSVSGGPILESYPIIGRRIDQWIIDTHTNEVRDYGRIPKAFSSTVYNSAYAPGWGEFVRTLNQD